MKAPIVLRIYRDEKLENVRQFQERQIVIGGAGDVQLELKDDSVSALHAMIEERGDDFFVSDLGSSAGTFKNGQKILEEPIHSGDEIKIGVFRIQFFVGAPKVVLTPPLSAVSTQPVPPLSAEPTQSAMSSEPPPPPAEPVSPTPPPLPPQPKAEDPAPVEEQVFTPVVPPIIDSQAGKKEEPPKAAPPPPMTPKSTSAPTPSAASKIESDKPEPKRSPVAVKVAATAGVRLPPPVATPKKSEKTFAPPSPYKDAKEIIRPGKGTAVEVVVLWKERVLATHHFFKKGGVTVGGAEGSDVMIPGMSAKTRFSLLKIHSGVTVFLSPEMTGELIRANETISISELARQNKVRSAGKRYELDLRQGEMIRVHIMGEHISLLIRYKAETPKPVVAPVLDLTASEVTGVILATVIAAIFALYMSLYAPANLNPDEARIEEPLRKAVVTFTPPTPKKIVEVKDQPVQPEKKKIVEVKEKPKQSPHPSVAKRGHEGKAGEVAPKKTHTKKKRLTSARSGGAIKTSKKEGANMKSHHPDPTKVGLLSVFSSKGTQSKLDKAYSGAGELQGLADRATGTAGDAENRPGDSIGTKLKEVGAGGKGSATIGISGVGTNGRGTGNTGYGSGGIGVKGSVKVNVGGQDAEFTGTIDRDAIRRVIQDHIRQIRSCYDRELQRHPDLYGKLVLQWDIGEKGRVLKAGTKSSSLGDSTVAHCILMRLKTWQFPEPPPDQVARVSYPFVFASK